MEHVRPDLFLRMDPLVLLGSLAGGNATLTLLLPGLMVILLTLVLGRFFCSTLCPLGTTIDLTDRLFRRLRKRLKGRVPGRARAWKYLVLSFAAGSVLAGSSLFLMVSPVSLATRFYGLVLYPVLASGLNLGAGLVRQAGDLLGIGAFAYLSVPVPKYSLAWATLGLVVPILALGLVVPRFWCRCLCPGGALFALLSLGRSLKREVSGACTDCSACRRACPMGAVGQDPRDASTAECIVCRKCAQSCPREAVTFRLRKPLAPFGGSGTGRNNPPGEPGVQGRGGGFFRSTCPDGPSGFSKGRRTLVLSGVFGAGGAAVGFALPGSSSAGSAAGPPIRPPGALPETDFLAGCVRCGACMRACPTNTLQPSSLTGGLARFFSPVVVPRTGPCEPGCTRCGRACPTGAIRELPAHEKVWAKIGTALIVRHLCLAWDKDKECLVCDEVCPFGAIDLRRAEGVKVSVPFVDASRCNGCGFCEYYCPVAGPSAVIVEPKGALRMAEGSYIRAGRAAGLRFEVEGPSRAPGEVSLPEGSLPPGFEE